MAPDRRLALRMSLTLGAVLVVDLAFALVVASLLSPWLAAIRDALGTVGLALPEPVYWIGVVGVGLGAVAWAHYGYARRRLLSAVEATPADREEHEAVRGRLTRLAATAALERPDLAVVDTPVPNSLAVGGPRGSTVVVSEGLLDRLDGDQLDAVLAHELAHVSNRDATVMTLASFLPAMASDRYNPLRGTRPAVLGLGLLVVHAVGVAVVDPVTGGLGSILGATILVVFALLFGGVALGLLAAPVLLLARRLSRDREFVADRAGARLSGDPAALATALSELSAEAADPPDEDVRATPDGIRGLCLLPHGFDGERDDWATTRSHPPVEERVARLRNLAADVTERVRERATEL